MRRRSEEDEKRTSLVREKLERNLDERRFVWSVGVQSWGGLAIAFVVPPSLFVQVKKHNVNKGAWNTQKNNVTNRKTGKKHNTNRSVEHAEKQRNEQKNRKNRSPPNIFAASQVRKILTRESKEG